MRCCGIHLRTISQKILIYIYSWNEFEIYFFDTVVKSPRGQWVKCQINTPLWGEIINIILKYQSRVIWWVLLSQCPQAHVKIAPSPKAVGVYSDFYPRPVLAFGYCHRLRLWVCVSVFVCVNHELVRTITHRSFKLGSPNLNQRCKTPWFRSLLFLRMIDLDLQGQI